MAKSSKPPSNLHSQRRTKVAGDGRSDRAKRLLINVFLGFHIIAITGWSVPISMPLTALAKAVVRPYFLWTGLFQSWDMFSPVPKTINSYVEAIVLYDDGNTRNWAFPRMECLSLTDRYVKERYRKFAENLEEDMNSPLWPDAARYIARSNNTRDVPIKMILLVRYGSAIMPRADGAYRPPPFDAYVFFSYAVTPEDLH